MNSTFIFIERLPSLLASIEKISEFVCNFSQGVDMTVWLGLSRLSKLQGNQKEAYLMIIRGYALSFGHEKLFCGYSTEMHCC